MEKQSYSYKGQNIEFETIPSVRITADGVNFEGDDFYITVMNGETVSTSYDPYNCIWVMEQNDKFQNIFNFCHGVELIDRYATPTVRHKCFNALQQLNVSNPNKLDMFAKSRIIAFFCEVGVWDNPLIRNKKLYDKEFRTYLYNCRWNYYLTEE